MAARIRTISLGDRKIGPAHPVYIIAEAGVNHNGDMKLAGKMVKVAAKAGADAVKFQAFKADLLASRGAPLATYQRKKSGSARTQRTMLKDLELAPRDFEKLKTVCEKENVDFLVSPFDLESLQMLLRIGVAAVKVASSELTDTPLLEQIARRRIPALVSTGAATLKEVKAAVTVLEAKRLRNIALLHCVSSYPAAYEDSNLRAIATLRHEFALPVGFSDHSPGIHIATGAVGAGALLLEKHITLDRRLPGPDQGLSLEPSELHSFVTAVRQVEHALGSGVKEPRDSEQNVRKLSRKSVVSTRAIKKGEKITPDCLTTKRPGTGIEPRHIRKVAGKRAKCDIRADTILTWDMV
ncbi:MAG: N-acetylneuraminate synthase [Planctomycetes bacterium]|nr:N-acetylneuraminate synthase [Planctomycetota bacterium]